MNMRTLMGMAGAAALAFGSAANALTIDTVASVTYAKESLETGSAFARKVSGVTHYVLAPTHAIARKAEVTAADDDTSDDYKVVFALTNMVFEAEPTIATVKADGTTTGATLTLERGGQQDDDFAVFELTTGTAVDATDVITLSARFAITADGPGGITRTITNKQLVGLPGVTSSVSRENLDAIKVARALVVTVTRSRLNGLQSDGFRSFHGATLTNPRILAGSLGTVEVGVAPMTRDARVADNTVVQTPTDIDDRLVTLTGLTGVATNEGIVSDATLSGATVDYGSAVTFSGDFSFIKKLTLGSPNASMTDCTGSEIRVASKTDPDVLTEMTTPKPVTDFASGALALCVAVDGDTPIPGTGSYMATTAFKGPADSAFPPVGDTYNLGLITRLGTVYRLPFLTVNQRHNQRINIVNRGPAATYTLGELATIEGNSVSFKGGGTDMTGDLPTGQTVLKVSDLLEMTGGTRASGTLSMPGGSYYIDVSVDIVNRENGTIDTVYVTPATETIEDDE